MGATALGRYAARAAVAVEDLDLVEVCLRDGLDKGLRRRRVDRIVIELTEGRPELVAEVLGARARAGRPDVPIVLFSLGEPGEGPDLVARIEALTGLDQREAEGSLRLFVADLGTLATALASSSPARLSGVEGGDGPDSHRSYSAPTVLERRTPDTVVEVA